MDVSGYLGLFGEAGSGLSEAEWLERANKHLPPNLSVLNAHYVDCSRGERWLRMSYEPRATARNFTQLSGGAIAEMLDQTATHCGSLVTGCPCPTLTMTVTILRPGTTATYVVTGRVLKLTRAAAVLAAELKDESGMTIATASVVSQLISDLGRLV